MCHYSLLLAQEEVRNEVRMCVCGLRDFWSLDKQDCVAEDRPAGKATAPRGEVAIK